MAHTKKWEEADSEFFQETYPSCDRTSTSSDLQSFLPPTVKKNHYSAIGIGSYSSNKSGTRTARMRATIQGLDKDNSDDDLEVLDFTDENLSTEDEVWKEIQKIKYMPVSLVKKKALKSQYQKCPKIKMRRHQKINFGLKKFTNAILKSFGNIRYNLQAMWSPPYRIQKSCGLDISTTFVVIKYSILLNLFYAFFMGTFIVLPYNIWSMPSSHNWFYRSDNVSELRKNGSFVKTIFDIARINLYEIKRTLASSFLFYGHYDKTSMMTSPSHYSLSTAYVSVVTGIIFTICFSIMLKLANVIKTLNYERSSDSWSKNVFGYWNYGMNNMIMVNDKHESMYKHIKFKLCKDKKFMMRWTCLGKICLVLTRVLLFFLTIGIGYAVGQSVYYIVETYSFPESDDSFPFASLYLSFIFCIFPWIFNTFKKFEKYHLNFEDNLYVTRLLALRLMTLYFFLSPIFEKRSMYPCYENEIGVKLLLLFILELCMKIFSTFFIHFPRVIISKYCCFHKSRISQRPYKAEFNIHSIMVENVFDLSLSAVGMLYCPFLPFICVIKSVITYFINLFHALVNSDCSLKVYSPSYIQMKFTFYYFLATICTTLIGGYIFAFVSPSRSCGPFANQDSPLINLIVDLFYELPYSLRNFLNFFIRSDVLSVCVMSLFCLAYAFYIKSKSSERVAVNLKSQLVLQGQDKKYLMSRINHLMSKSTKTEQRKKSKS